MNSNNNNLNNLFKSSLFAQTPQKDAKALPFGSSSQQLNTGSSAAHPFTGGPFITSNTDSAFSANKQFGGNTSQSPNSVFNAQTLPSGHSNIFGTTGGSNTNFDSSAQGSGVFGQNTFGSSFGQTGQNVFKSFGQQSAQSSSIQQQTNPFSQTSNNSNMPYVEKSNIFGSSSPQNPFLQSTSNTSPVFKTENTGWETKGAASLFGNQGTNGVFPSLQQQTGSLASITQTKNGTKTPQYKPQKLREDRSFVDSEFMHINAMKEYSDKSSDELRYEDYSLGRLPVKNQSDINSLNQPGVFRTETPKTQNVFQNPTQSSPPPTIANQNANFSFMPQNTLSALPSTPLSFDRQASMFSQVKEPLNTAPQNSLLVPPASSNESYQYLQQSPNFQHAPGQSTPFCTPFTGYQSENNSVGNNVIFPSTHFEQKSPIIPHSFVQEVCPKPFDPVKIDKSDPFLLKNIKFERIEKTKAPFTKMLLEPVFLDDTKKCPVSLNYRAPKPVVKKAIYTMPSYEDVRLFKEIDGLVIGFENRGRIEYLDKVLVKDITIKNIENKVMIHRNFVSISDPPGIGLNKRARVFIEGIYAFSKSEGDFIIGRASKFPLKGIQERFVYSLKEDPYRKFIDYDYDKGLYVYEVNHF